MPQNEEALRPGPSSMMRYQALIAEGAGEFRCELWPAVERMAAGSEGQAAQPGTGGLDGGRDNGGQARADAAQANADHLVRADLGHELLGGSEVGLGMEGVVGVALGDPELDLAWEGGQRAQLRGDGLSRGLEGGA